MPKKDGEGPPSYKVYRSRPRIFGGAKDDKRLTTPPPDGGERRERDDRGGGEQRERDDRGGNVRRTDGAAYRELSEPAYTRRRRRPRILRVLKWIVLAFIGWILLSLILFMVSATLQRGDTSNETRDSLVGAGWPLTSPNTILVLGSDARQPGTKEPGANVGGPSRSDSILLIRTGGGKSARLSIPRDTLVDIPGFGTNKINAAYALGGPALAIETIERFMEIEINHVVEVDFGNFPRFIDALGGVDVATGCVRSDINGGSSNGGFSLRLRSGVNRLNGEQALALARTRTNDCNPSENDLTRARRQQKILAGIKSRLVSPAAFIRMPWIAWEAPKTIRSDMGGPTLLGLFGGIQAGGDPATAVLKPSRVAGGGLVVSPHTVARERRKFLDG